VRIKGQFFLILATLNIATALSEKKKPQKALLEHWGFFPLVQVVTLL